MREADTRKRGVAGTALPPKTEAAARLQPRVPPGLGRRVRARSPDCSDEPEI